MSNIPQDVLDYLRGARIAADCRRRKVGAVATTKGRITGVGWNGLPTGSCTAGDCPRGALSYDQVPAFSPYAGNCDAVHAERSALKMSPYADTLYVTCQPCPDCEVLIEDYGVKSVIVIDESTKNQ